MVNPKDNSGDHHAPLIAHTFRISQETLDELKRMGNGNESLGARRALEASRNRSAKTFAWGALAGFVGAVIAHLVFFAAMAP